MTNHDPAFDLDLCACGHYRFHHSEGACTGLRYLDAYVGMGPCPCKEFETPPPTPEQKFAALEQRVAELERVRAFHDSQRPNY